MTLTLDKLNTKGKADGSVTLDEPTFDSKPNKHVLHLAVLRELANSRSGSANSKTRAEVRGGGRKPWKQKGTGRARAGSIRSPLWRGGGVIFGPKPRSFEMTLPKKVRRLALKSAWIQAALEGKLSVIADFSFISEPKTKIVNEFLVGLGVKGAKSSKVQKVLVLADYRAKENQHLLLAARNLPEIKLRLPQDLSVKDFILADRIVVTEGALQEIRERFVSHG